MTRETEDAGDDRAVSEFTGVAILVALTVLVTASVGLNVLVADELTSDGAPDANFSFQHVSATSSLIVTFERGDEIPAGNVSVRGNDGGATWAELASTNETELIGPGATVQASNQNAFGARVTQRSSVRVVYLNETGQEQVLERWEGG